jgi:ATP-dependent protease ClpP protease subunit
VIGLYTPRMKGRNRKQIITDMLTNDTILDAKQALKIGLIDKIL